jgi:hypothetical protein
MPEVGGGVAVRWVDPAAPWLATAGGAATSTTYGAAVVARVALRYDDAKADLVHDEEYEAVLHPLAAHVDVTRALAVDYDDRDLREEAPSPISYRLSDAPISEPPFWRQLPRDLVDHLTRSLTLEIPCNRQLDRYGRPGETVEAFASRCRQAADDEADADTAKLRDKYAAKVARLEDQIDAASDAAAVADRQQQARTRDDLLSSAGSILGGLLGGRRRTGGLLGQVGRAAGRRSRTSAARSRVDAAENKVDRLEARLQDLEQELTEELAAIDERWRAAAADIGTMSIGLEKTDVKVTHLALAWMPVPS